MYDKEQAQLSGATRPCATHDHIGILQSALNCHPAAWTGWRPPRKTAETATIERGPCNADTKIRNPLLTRKKMDVIENIEKSENKLDQVKLDQVLAMLGELTRQKAAKEWYSTTEVARIMGRSGYTVREWCRKKQITGEKASNGRGWLISHSVLERLRNLGPLPEPTH
jgi:Helix-turn-helix domain